MFAYLKYIEDYVRKESQVLVSCSVLPNESYIFGIILESTRPHFWVDFKPLVLHLQKLSTSIYFTNCAEIEI